MHDGKAPTPHWSNQVSTVIIPPPPPRVMWVAAQWHWYWTPPPPRWKILDETLLQVWDYVSSHRELLNTYRWMIFQIVEGTPHYKSCYYCSWSEISSWSSIFLSLKIKKIRIRLQSDLVNLCFFNPYALQSEEFLVTSSIISCLQLFSNPCASQSEQSLVNAVKLTKFIIFITSHLWLALYIWYIVDKITRNA